MKTITNLCVTLPILATLVMLSSGCGSDDNPAGPEDVIPTVLRIMVESSADSSLIENSNVVLYQAGSREAVLRGMTNADGIVYFDCESGNYFVNVSAQGYYAVPPENIAPLPFFVAGQDTTLQEVLLNPIEDIGGSGYILGYIEPPIDNFLVLAGPQAAQDKYSTVSGPDGFFVIYNLPYGTYTMDALKSGYQMDAPVEASISPEAEVDSLQIPVSAYTGSVLKGMVTFLASENSTVDITLLDPETRSVIPGLAVMSDVEGLNYRISDIPDGSYLAWASLQNDGYVIDPDWIFKNPGGLDISFDGADSLELNFSVTDAIEIVSPTNPPDSAFAFMADSQVPTFRWRPYPSAKEYFIEVRDNNGNVLWGGFGGDGWAHHGFIAGGLDSVVYNFDEQPSVPPLLPGKIYQWRLWADKGTQQNSYVEQLISSSEDLLGVFQVPEGPQE